MATAQIGKPVRRIEDQKFITGAGRYTDDIQLPGMTYCAFVRSPHAHAAIEGVDTAAAAAAPGVVTVLTGADVEADGLGGLPCAWQVDFNTGEPMNEPPHPVLASDTVRYVGDGVACVIAETQEQAQDAAELVEVSYRELPALASVPEAVADGAPQIHAEAKGNLAFIWDLGDREATDAACANSAHLTTLEFVNQRLIPNAIEPRATLADFDAASGRSTLYTSTQNPHTIRAVMGGVLGLPEHKLRVVGPDVGGGFGSKIFHYPEEAAVTWARPQDRPAGEVDGFAQRELHDRRARPRPRHHGQPGARCRREVHGVAGAHAGEHGRIPVAGGVCDPDLPVRDAAAGPVHDAGRPRRGHRGLHQHHPGGRLPRRRPGRRRPTCWSGWSTPPRMRPASTPRRSAAGTSYRRSTASQSPATRRRWRWSTTAVTTAAPWTGRWRCSTCRRSAQARRPRGRKESCSASASPATSRRAAWRRPRSPAPSARAAASTRVRPCACSPRAR